ncbi:MAG: NUDIX domain-containing protein [Chlamydiota bacterium]|nr:NUDIX domain-containing protein [Chlamydiota bacterium]
MKRQFCATTYIIKEEKFLLIFHRKLQKWLPPGGHVEPNETPPECAKREALEETGLVIEILKQENIWVEDWNANSFERPFMCMLEEIPEYGKEPAHQHMDMVYVGTPVGGKLKHNEGEVDDIRWFTLDEIERLQEDVEIYAETKKSTREISKNYFGAKV